MSSVTVFCGQYCRATEICQQLASECGLRFVEDHHVVALAAKASGLSKHKVEKALRGRSSMFNKFTLENERAVAWLRLSLAQLLHDDGLLIAGFAAHLAPMEISHLLRICLISDLATRIDRAGTHEGLGERDAQKKIAGDDEDRANWVVQMRGVEDPWSPSLYDILIPTDKVDVDGAVALIRENLQKGVLRTTPESKQAVDDFHLAARVEVALAKEGHAMTVRAHSGEVTVTINKHVLLLSRLQEELAEIVAKVEGVESVDVEVGEEFYKADVYRRYEFETPNKVLLVDDEREFVQTLSERLQMREMGSAVVYDGESALEAVTRDEPEVMILDLKMPGIDGIEVLRRVKESHPEIEIVILTGHGTEKDRDLCMELGAFAYLQKPVDIDILSETLRKANAQAQENLKQKGQEPSAR